LEKKDGRLFGRKKDPSESTTAGERLGTVYGTSWPRKKKTSLSAGFQEIAKNSMLSRMGKKGRRRAAEG